MNIEIPKADAEYMYKFVQQVVSEVGPRMPCSPQEAQGAKMLQDELSKNCDEVAMESFTCHPMAFLGWVKIISVMTYSSIVLYLIAQLFSEYFWLSIFGIIIFSLVFLSFLIMWEEFFNYRELIDKFFRKKSSQNVIGTFKPKAPVRKIIIFSGHIDTALEFNLLKWLKGGSLLIMFVGLLILLFWLVISFINLVIVIIGFISLKGIFVPLTIILLIVAAPFYVGLFFFVSTGDKGNVVPGAVDNLSSCSVLIGLSKYLKENRDVIPEDIEVRLIGFGSEESGLRGAYRYTVAHLDELLKNDANIVNMDGLETPDSFFVIEYEPTTRTKHSEEVVQNLLIAAKSVDIEAKRFGAGLFEKVVGFFSGGSDAAAFSKAKIKAAFLNSADWKNRSKHYHQHTDTPDKIKEGTLENALKICIAYLQILY